MIPTSGREWLRGGLDRSDFQGLDSITSIHIGSYNHSVEKLGAFFE